MSGMAQAISNSNDAVNMVKTAEGALSEVHSLLRTMRDLAVHSSNTGANDSTAIAADQTQMSSAISALNRISANTQFGNKKLLDGTAGVSGQTTDADVAFIGGTASTAAGTYSINVTTAAAKANVTSTGDLSGGIGAGNDGNLVINGTTIALTVADTDATTIAKINAQSSLTGVSATSAAGNTFKLEQTSYGSANTITVSGTAATLTKVGLTATTTSNGANVAATLTKGGVDYALTGSGAVLSGAANTDTAGMSLRITGGAGAQGNVVVTNNSLTFQIGANVGQTASQSLTSVAATQLGTAATGLTNSWTSVADIDVTTASGAQDALRLIDSAISQVSTTRAQLGAFQQSMQSNINSLGVSKENISASESSVRDTDMAAEMVKFTRNQIMMQAGSSMLSQANQAPQSILSILRG
ncbi:MAG: flagellin [Armatimonadota bacterium]